MLPWSFITYITAVEAAQKLDLPFQTQRDPCTGMLLSQCAQAEMQLCTHVKAVSFLALHYYFHREALSTSGKETCCPQVQQELEPQKTIFIDTIMHQESN